MSDTTYEKRFRMSVVVTYRGDGPLHEVDTKAALRDLQDALNAGLPHRAGPANGLCKAIVEPPAPLTSVSDKVDAVLRALKRGGFDVS